MGIYATNNQLGGSEQNLSSSYKTLVSVFATSGSLRRAKVNMIAVGTDGAAANNSMVWDVSRMTVDGTGTAVTPNALDAADVAALATSKANYTAEPTVTANSSLWNDAINQQLSYVWQAVPDRGELIIPATANNGLVLRAKSGAYTSTATGHLQFIE